MLRLQILSETLYALSPGKLGTGNFNWLTPTRLALCLCRPSTCTSRKNNRTSPNHLRYTMDLPRGLRRIVFREKMSRKRKCSTPLVNIRINVKENHKAVEVVEYTTIDQLITSQASPKKAWIIRTPVESAISQTNEVENNHKICFLDLPIEIRQLIYEHYFGGWTLRVFDLGKEHTPLVNLPNMNLLLTSQIIHHEAKQILGLAFKGCAEILHLGPGDLLELGKYQWLQTSIRSVKIDDHSWDRIARFDDTIKWPSLRRIELFARFKPRFIIMDDADTPAGVIDKISKSLVLQDAEPWIKDFQKVFGNGDKVALEIRQRYWVRKFKSQGTTPFFLETIVEFRDSRRKVLSRKLHLDMDKERAEQASIVESCE